MENFNIIEEKENSLFKRKEIKFSVDSEVNPSHADARKIVSEKFSTPEENIRIKKILGKFGSKNFTILVNIYASEQDKLDTEGKSKKDAVAGDTPLQNPEEKSDAQKEEPVEQSAEATPEIPSEPATPIQDAQTSEPSQPEEPSNKPDESNEQESEQITEEPKEEIKE